MKQQQLFKPLRQPRSIKRLTNDFDVRNLALAQAFIEDPQLCGGEGSFGLVWARAVVKRLGGAERE